MCVDVCVCVDCVFVDDCVGDCDFGEGVVWC